MNNNPILSKNEIKEKTHLLFINLAKYNHSKNSYFISQQTLSKILIESKIISPTQRKTFDILFKSVSPKSQFLSYEQFLSLLIQLAQKQNKNTFDQNPKQILNNFFTALFDTFNDINDNSSIDTSFQYKSMKNLISYMPDNEQTIVINEICFTLNEIYIKYFEYESSYNDALIKKSSLNLISFMRDFEIMPYILNETRVMNYYDISIGEFPKGNGINFITCMDNKGYNFTFYNFCLMIVHMSILLYIKCIQSTNAENEVNDKEVSKLLMFLERMENSKGMKGFTRKLNRPCANKLCLIPSKETFIQLGEIDDESVVEVSEDICESRSYNNNESGCFENNEFGFDKVNMNKINAKMTELERTFTHFARIGDKLNFNQMNLSSYISFVKHCELGFKEDKNKKHSEQGTVSNNSSHNSHLTMNNKPLLSKSDVNVIFSKLTGPRNISTDNTNTNNNSISRMNFNTFIRSFIHLASKLLPFKSKQTALTYILDNHILTHLIPEDISLITNNNLNNNPYNNILPNNSNTNVVSYTNIKNTKEYIRNSPSIKDFLKELCDPLGNYYLQFCNEKDMMSFNNLHNFYKSFGLFPDIINLIQLKNIFSYLVDTNKINLNDKLKSNKPCISFQDFVYSLALTALLYDFDESYSDIDKLLYLVERMNQSSGIQKCQMKSGKTYSKTNDMVTFLINMKKKYPGFYNVEESKGGLKGLDDVYGEDEEGSEDNGGVQEEGEGEEEEEDEGDSNGSI